MAQQQADAPNYRNARSKAPQASLPAATETKPVKSNVPYADLFPKPSGAT
jgi:hypothetical protein